jgi:hypothetical protein
MLDLLTLADTAASSGSDLKTILPWVTSFVIAVLGLVMRNQAKREGEATGKAQAMLIANQPLSVTLEEKLEQRFVLRRDFERLESSVDRNMTEVKGLFAQTMQAIEAQAKTTDRRIENQSKRILETVESVAKAANDGRGKLWKKVNEEAEKLATVKAETNVAKEIGKLGDVVSAAIAPTKPTAKQLS